MEVEIQYLVRGYPIHSAELFPLLLGEFPFGREKQGRIPGFFLDQILSHPPTAWAFIFDGDKALPQ